LHRLYSTFPGGLSGAGLFLLRVALGGTLIIQGSAYMRGLGDSGFGPWAVCLLLLASGGALVIGILTPIASALAFLVFTGVTFSLVSVQGWNLFSGNPLSIDAIVMALATSFLGPGAFSFDARLFGRRKIIIPRASSSLKS